MAGPQRELLGLDYRLKEAVSLFLYPSRCFPYCLVDDIQPAS